MHILMRLALMKVLSFKVNKSPSFVSVQDNVQKADRYNPTFNVQFPNMGSNKKNFLFSEVCLIKLNKDSRLIIICISPFRKVNTKTDDVQSRSPERRV